MERTTNKEFNEMILDLSKKLGKKKKQLIRELAEQRLYELEVIQKTDINRLIEKYSIDDIEVIIDILKEKVRKQKIKINS